MLWLYFLVFPTCFCWGFFCFFGCYSCDICYFSQLLQWMDTWAQTIKKVFGYKGRCLYAEDMRKTPSIKCFFHRVFLPSSTPWLQRGTVDGVTEGFQALKAGWWGQIYFPFLFQWYFLCPTIWTLREMDVAVREQSLICQVCRVPLCHPIYYFSQNRERFIPKTQHKCFW